MKRRNATYAYILLAAVLVWQVGAFVHLTTTRHEVCVHGKIVQQRHHTDGDPSSPTESHHDHKTHQDGCRLLASLTTPNATASHLIPVDIAIFESADLSRDDEVEAFVRVDRERFRLSPSHSPPMPA
jgi:hypothetical protein